MTPLAQRLHRWALAIVEFTTEPREASARRLAHRPGRHLTHAEAAAIGRRTWPEGEAGELTPEEIQQRMVRYYPPVTRQAPRLLRIGRILR